MEQPPHQKKKLQRCHKTIAFVDADEGANAVFDAVFDGDADGADIIHILKGGAFKGHTVGAVENAEITTYVHLPDLVYLDGVWHYW